MNCLPKNELSVKNHDRITLKICDCKKEMSTIVKSEFIVLDIDPHDGIEEINILAALSANDFRGIVLLDDIHLNQNMEQFWQNLPMKKIDVTKYGHWSGTGLLIFDSERFNIILE
jgi:hypothetical protein